MIQYENECRECATPNYPCDPNCELKGVAHLFCDECGDEVVNLYWFDNRQLCNDCITDELEEVEP